MLLKWTDEYNYDKGGTTIPTSSNRIKWAAPPREITGEMSGAGIVAQYLEAFKYRTDAVRKISDMEITKLYEKALELDESIVDTPCDVPTLRSLLQACVDLKYVKRCSYKFFNTIDALKYYLADYGCCIVQLKFTSTTQNAHGFKIESAGNEISYDVNKGYIAFGYDSDGILLQNTLGPKSGSLGFNWIPWQIFNQVYISGASFTVL